MRCGFSIAGKSDKMSQLWGALLAQCDREEMVRIGPIGLMRPISIRRAPGWIDFDARAQMKTLPVGPFPAFRRKVLKTYSDF
jgi:hypothetical protein